MALQFIFANNAGSTLAGPINNTTTSIALVSGGGAIFPQPNIGTQQFEVTLIDAATGLIREIVYCTARSGDTLTVLRGQESTTAENYLAGDLAQELWTAGQCAAFTQNAQIPIITVPVSTFYVNASTGSDTLYNGQSAAVSGSNGPWATLQHAVNAISSYFSFSAVTVNVANGTYAGFQVNFNFIASWNFVGASQTACFINSSINFSNSSSFTLSGFSISSTSGADLIYATFGSQVNINNCNFTGATSSGAVIACIQGSSANMLGNVTISGSYYAIWRAYILGVVSVGFGGALSVTFSGVTVSSATASCAQGAITFWPISTGAGGPISFSGTPTGSRYLSTQNGVINTAGSGTTYIPGSAGGTTSVGGQYV